ncbi:MAG: hybrid sensor histidine kinase/response regulator [Oceanospirillaceae bacterium]|nr:hybrid sensor histidine kinase/response regulator [Oceanospirillaceae bacterium]
MDTLLGSLLAGSHQVVLECLSESEYSTLTPIPEVMQPLFDDSRIRIEELPFLEHFFFLADEYWQQPEDDSLQSGSWVEELDNGKELSLEATARIVDGRRLVVLEYLGDRYQQEVVRLQAMRDKLLFSEKLEAEVRLRTARIQAREARMTEEVSEQVEQKTAELQDAKDKAEATSESKTTFLATMSHEIRTPMNGVLGAADMLAESQALTDDDRELIGIIKTSGSLMLNIINDILDYSRMNSGRVELEYRPFQLGSMIEGIAKVMRPIVVQKSLQLDVVMDDSTRHLELNGDDERLKQVLVNLIGNAAKFTENGGVTVSARLLARDKGQVSVRVAITDTGIGIRKEAQASLFELFTQADASTSRKYGGTGLGLSICKQIVELMGGEIGVDSEWGQGSTFWFELTLAEVVRDAKGSAQAGDAATEDIPPLAVLVADDNPINQTIMQRMLGKMGHRVVTVGDGSEAVDIVQKQHFDVIFMDWMMPKMDGIQATCEIRKLPDEQQSQIPVIALTANSMAGHESQCMEAGMNTFVTKPTTAAAVRQALHGLFAAEA